MIDTVQTIKKAIELRRSGSSYTDIAKALKVSRSAICGWVKNVRLTEAEKNHLHKNLQAKMEKGRLMASITLRSGKVFKEKVAYDTAEKEFDIYSKDPFFMLGMGLWGVEKNSKNRSSFTFTTSDPETQRLLGVWITKYLKMSAKSLKWRVFGGKSTSTSYTMSKMAAVRKLIAWQKLTMRYYS